MLVTANPGIGMRVIQSENQSFFFFFFTMKTESKKTAKAKKAKAAPEKLRSWSFPKEGIAIIAPTLEEAQRLLKERFSKASE